MSEMSELFRFTKKGRTLNIGGETVKTKDVSFVAKKLTDNKDLSLPSTMYWVQDENGANRFINEHLFDSIEKVI